MGFSPSKRAVLAGVLTVSVACSSVQPADEYQYAAPSDAGNVTLFAMDEEDVERSRAVSNTLLTVAESAQPRSAETSSQEDIAVSAARPEAQASGNRPLFTIASSGTSEESNQRMAAAMTGLMNVAGGGFAETTGASQEPVALVTTISTAPTSTPPVPTSTNTGSAPSQIDILTTNLPDTPEPEGNAGGNSGNSNGNGNSDAEVTDPVTEADPAPAFEPDPADEPKGNAGGNNGKSNGNGNSDAEVTAPVTEADPAPAIEPEPAEEPKGNAGGNNGKSNGNGNSDAEVTAPVTEADPAPAIEPEPADEPKGNAGGNSGKSNGNGNSNAEVTAPAIEPEPANEPKGNAGGNSGNNGKSKDKS